MPIYAYKCSNCGHSLDVLQKISDAPLTDCPSCGAAALAKQVTAAGFQLKGSGWYVTDFRDGNKAGAKKDGADAPADKPADKSGADAAAPAAAEVQAAAPAPAAASASTPAAAPASPPSGSGS